jgi:hypothetical protein
MQQKYVQQKQLRQRQAQQKDAQERQPAGLSELELQDKCICRSGTIAGLMREIERMPGNRAYRKMRKRLGKNG